MWESRRLLARFPRGSWEEWEACPWLSTLSTATAFPQLSSLAEASGLRLQRGASVVGYCGPGSFFFLLFFSR
jgi:hypothetical protein